MKWKPETAKITAQIVAAALVVGGVASSLLGYKAPVFTTSVQAYEPPESSDSAMSDAVSTPDLTEEEAEEEIGKGAFDLEDGVYRGTGVGYSGNIVVDVTIKDRSITAIEIVSQSDTEPYITVAKNGVIAAILKDQSYEVDAVTGATYSSRGIMRAVRNAITGEEDASAPGSSIAGGAAPADGSSSASIGSVSEPSSYKDGTYTGSGQGYGGTTTVTVTVSGGKIASISVNSNHDTAEYFSKAKNRVISSILSAQSTNVDAVTGATYSSRGIIQAVRNALGKAGGSSSGSTETSSNASAAKPADGSKKAVIAVVSDPSALSDGSYSGSGRGFGGTTKVTVTVSGGKITGIRVDSNEDTDEYFNMAKSPVIVSILSKQSTNVDAVTGATYSSRGIIEAVRDALDKAAKTSADSGNSSADSGKSTDSGTDSEVTEGHFPYPEGIYEGTGEGMNGKITVQVAIQDKTIKAIVVKSTEDDQPFFTNAQQVLRDVVTKQSTEVDTVSGATFSSTGLLDAVKNALETAKNAAADDYGLKKDDTASGTSGTESGTTSGTTDSGASGTDSGSSGTESGTTSGSSGTDSGTTSSSDGTESGATSSTTGAESGTTGGTSGTESGTTSGAGGTESGTSSGAAGTESDPTVTNGYKDGEYAAAVLCEPDEDGDFDAYTLSLKITVSGGKITAVTDVSDGGSGNSSYVRRAANGRGGSTGLVSQITSRGTATESDVFDTVSGATRSSQAIIAAVKAAFASAKVS